MNFQQINFAGTSRLGKLWNQPIRGANIRVSAELKPAARLSRTAGSHKAKLSLGLVA